MIYVEAGVDKEMEALVSIIIPFYNDEEYISECIQSVVNQTYINIEIILIDDGSYDNSYTICEKFADMDNRIKLFRQKNSGVSKARNIGIQNAIGKYICFIDADDYVRNDFVELMVKHMVGKQIVICGYKRMENECVRKVYITECMTVEELYKKVFSEYSIHTGCWNKCFVSDVIKENKLFFDENISIGEDMLFLAKYLLLVENRYYCISDSLYFHRKNMKSALQKTYSSRGLDIKKVSVLYSLEELLKLSPPSDLKKYYSYRAVKGSLWFLLQMIYGNCSNEKYFENIRKNVRDNIKAYMNCKSGNLLEDTLACLVYINPKIVYKVGRICLKYIPELIKKNLE